jgi:hypothetical protein
LYFSHRTYVANLVKRFSEFSKQNPAISQRLFEMKDSLLLLSLLELEHAHAKMIVCYAPRHSGAQKPYDPVVMLRSFLLMALCGFSSINKWQAHLKGHPELIILAGFPKEKPPSVGTFYAFMNRLLNGTYKKKCSHVTHPSEHLKGKRFLRHLKGEKALRKEQFTDASEGKVKLTVDKAIASLKNHLPDDFITKINELLMLCVVIPSAERGFLGNLNKLVVAGDGSVLPSHATGRGHSRCYCHEEGIQKCNCARYYSDPSATWGWDSYHEKYYFGYRLHAMCINEDGRDLPVHLMLDGAHNHDSIMGVHALVRLHKQLRKYLPYAKMKYGIFDAGYDSNAFYSLFKKLDVTAIIPLNRRNIPRTDANQVERNEKGIPICPGGIEYKLHGTNKRRRKVVYHCPAKYLGRVNGKQQYKVDLSRCPLGVLCEPDSVMGPLINLHFDNSPRLNPEVPRETKLFKKLYKQRTTCERFFSRIERQDLKRGAYRRNHIFLFRSMCEAMIAHGLAWVKKRFGHEKLKTLEEVFDRMLECVKL